MRGADGPDAVDPSNKSMRRLMPAAVRRGVGHSVTVYSCPLLFLKHRVTCLTHQRLRRSQSRSRSRSRSRSNHYSTIHSITIHYTAEASHAVRRKRSAHATKEKDLRKELLEAATSSAVSDGQPTTQQPSADRKYQVQCVLCKKTGWRKKPKKGGQWQCTCKGYAKMLHMECGSTAGMCKC